MITTAFIYLWNERVGAIAWNPRSGLASFEFDHSFSGLGWDVAPLKMPIGGRRGSIYSFPELRESLTFKGLPGLLADALPDRYGSTLINAWLARNGRPADSLNPVELLCFIGKRGVGALEFEPAESDLFTGTERIELDTLIEAAREIMSGRKEWNARFTAEEEKSMIDVLRIGTSAGGARAKAVIAYNPQTGEIRSGQAQAPAGFSHWLLKFDGVQDQQLGSSSGYGRIEMAYHLMALEAGIDMMECRLLEENGRAHFMTRRFDRTDDQEKIHTQSFCALAHFDFNEVNAYSYEQLFEVMRKLMLPYDDAEQLFRRMAFNVMARNCDDHTKNFSLLMDRSGRWRFSPAYDVCHAFRPESVWVSQHALSVNGKRIDINRADIISVAKQMNIKKAPSVLNDVLDAVSRWDYFARQTDVSAALRKSIASTMRLL